jgi:hypothetical protein
VAASTLGIPAVADLVADTVAVGRRLGLAVDDPIVLKDSLNLLVWLRPSPVVARVQVRTGLVRRPEALADSLALARHLAGAGLPVSPPVDDVDPGPHVGSTGRAMTLWRHLNVLDRPADPSDVGRSLRRLHEAAASYEGPIRHVGPIEEIGRLAEVLRRVRPDDANRLLELCERLELPDQRVQALHGDAHMGNVVVTDAGACWVDWEESWRGPIAWDLACLEHQRRTFGQLLDEIGAALVAYGPHDVDAVEAWLPVVALWAAAWGLVGDVDGLGWSANATRRLEWVEQRLGSKP